MAKLTNEELRAIISAHLNDTLSTTDGELRSDREQALNFYYGRPMGNEIDGRAQVVSKDMMDTIEWMMPSLLRIFTRDALQFDPVGPEDEKLARQETDYVNHVFWKKNPGFMILYNWIKDGLMQKNGYVKYFWDDAQTVSFDQYSGLSDEQLVMTLGELEKKGKVEIIGYERGDDGTHDFRAKIVKNYGCAKVENCPPEEIIVDSQCRADIKKAKFAGHLVRKTRSELLEMGFKRKRIERLTEYNFNPVAEEQARDSAHESYDKPSLASDWASQELRLLECYLYVDADDDGIAELRRFLMGGNDILENEEFPEIPFESWTPIPIPHRHIGLGIYDLIEDLQRIKTALTRSTLDNAYFVNNQRILYDKNTVDIESLQINRPGGHVAVDGPPSMSAMPMPLSTMAGNLLPVIDYVDAVKETRVGVGRMTSGVDADVLAQSTKGAYTDAKSAANQRIEAIARIFAETGLSSLYASLHRLLSRHQSYAERIKLTNGWSEPINPAEWMDRANLTVSVGLGNASREEIRANLQQMAMAQQAAAQVPGLIQPKNVYSLFRRMQTELGFEQEAFITDPESPEYQQFMQSQAGQKDPFVQGEEVKAQANMAGKQLDAQIKREQMAQDRDLKITEMEISAGVDLAKAGIGAEVGLARTAAQESGKREAAAREQPASGSV